MAQASMRTVLSELLARRIIDHMADIQWAQTHPDDGSDDDITEALGAGTECRLIARLCGVEADVEAQIAKIQRANAKEAQP